VRLLSYADDVYTRAQCSFRFYLGHRPLSPERLFRDWHSRCRRLTLFGTDERTRASSTAPFAINSFPEPSTEKLCL
jgi:hypothetical protein